MSSTDSKSFTNVPEPLESSLPTRPIRLPPVGRSGSLANIRISGVAVFQDRSMQIDGAIGIDQLVRIRFDGTRGIATLADFTMEERSATGPAGDRRQLTFSEDQGLLSALRIELRSPHASISHEVVRRFAARLAEALGLPLPSGAYDGARFGRVERAADGGITAELGMGSDRSATIHLSVTGRLTCALHLFSEHSETPGPLSAADLASLETNLEAYLQTQRTRAEPLWSELLTGVKKQTGPLF